MGNKSPVLAAVAFFVIGCVFGFLFGRLAGMAEQGADILKLKPLIDLAYPQPPANMTSMTGTVQGIYGATIALEVDDPSDYLPHLDNTPRKKLTRSADTSSQTKYVLVDYHKLDFKGNPKITSFTLSDLKVGDVITVRSNQNLRSTEKFDATEVQLVRL